MKPYEVICPKIVGNNIFSTNGNNNNLLLKMLL